MRDIMFVRGVSQAELAVLIGVEPSGLSRRINGIADWTPEEIENLARVLRVGVGRLFQVPLDVGP